MKAIQCALHIFFLKIHGVELTTTLLLRECGSYIYAIENFIITHLHVLYVAVTCMAT